MEKDLISVVVPIYNVEDYLPRCIESIRRQTYRDLQIILVDDGSLDHSGEIADQAAEKDHRIAVIHKQNGGLSDARNAGISAAKGKYITFIDSDDYISPDYVEYLHNLILHSGGQISICGLKKTKENLDTEKLTAPVTQCFTKEEAITQMLYARIFSTSACAKLYQLDLFRNVRFPLGKFSEDMFTTYKLLDQAQTVVYGSQICYYYYRRAGSIIASAFSAKHMDVVEGLRQMRKEIPIAQYGAEKAFASQMVECIAAMLERKPSAEEIRSLGLWQLFCQYRATVLKDPQAAKRVRAYALVSYLGLPLTIRIISTYYGLKWRKT